MRKISYPDKPIDELTKKEPMERFCIYDKQQVV